MTIIPDATSNITFIGVEGELVSGDEQKFVQLAIQHPKAVVLFNSPGGSLVAGIEIGRAIRLKGYWTYVPGGLSCASACALAWLGGVERYMERNSKIGFHAAYDSKDGQTSGGANAVVGSYLTKLGFSEDAIYYVTDASPNSMTWMNYDDAIKVGIAVHLTEPSQQQNQVEQPRLIDPSTTPSNAESLIELPGSDIFGHDLPGMPLKNVTRTECENACTSDSRCLAFTFNRKYSACFLKSAGERVFSNANADAGYKAALSPILRHPKITILEATDLPGGDFNELKDVGFGVCSDTCEEDRRCRAFTYLGKSKTCWLKSVVPTPSRTKKAISGIKQ